MPPLCPQKGQRAVFTKTGPHLPVSSCHLSLAYSVPQLPRVLILTLGFPRLTNPWVALLQLVLPTLFTRLISVFHPHGRCHIRGSKWFLFWTLAHQDSHEFSQFYSAFPWEEGNCTCSSSVTFALHTWPTPRMQMPPNAHPWPQLPPADTSSWASFPVAVVPFLISLEFSLLISSAYCLTELQPILPSDHGALYRTAPR